MQHEEPDLRIPSGPSHPEPSEWMELLYDEAPPKRKRELKAHLAQCPECAEQMEVWKVSRADLNEWKAVVPSSARSGWHPVLQWAAAAVVVLGFGFILGRITSPSTREIAKLKVSVAQLAQAVQRERGQNLTNAILAATTAANTETVRLFTQYSMLQDAQRAADQQNLQSVLQSFDSRLGKFQTGLETVAINTADSFQQTHQNLARLASYSVPKNTVDPLSSEPR